jgi:hypothetical protein
MPIFLVGKANFHVVELNDYPVASDGAIKPGRVDFLPEQNANRVCDSIRSPSDTG